MLNELEDAIVKRIKDAAGQLTYKLPTVESWKGQLEEGSQATFKYPAVFVTFGEWNETRGGGRLRNVDISYVIFCASRNIRNELAAREGEVDSDLVVRQAGSYQLAEDVNALVNNQSFDLVRKKLFAVTKKEPMPSKVEGVSVMAVTIQGTFEYQTALPDCQELTDVDLLKIVNSYYLRPTNTSATDPDPDKRLPNFTSNAAPAD